MPKYLITGFMKVLDVVEGDNKIMAESRFVAKYPGFIDKESKITEIIDMNDSEEQTK